jgi:hypothetical protein
MNEREKAANRLAERLAKSGPKFDPGRVVMTPGAISALANNNALVSEYLIRHISGDWGDAPPEDARANERDLKAGLRLLSSYSLPKGDRLWIITDSLDTETMTDPLKREVTTILTPSEY